MTIRSGDSIEVKTERLAYGGDAVARHGKMVLFIPYAAPDEVVRVRVTTVKKTFARAVIEEVVTPSPVRRTPECRYFGVCGGCQLQHIDYTAQLKSKADFIRDSLARLGHIDWPGEIEVEPSPEFGYRTRAQIKIQETLGSRSSSGSPSDKLLIGFNKHGSHSVCDVESCPILEPSLNSALGELRTVLAARTLGGSEPPPTEVEIAAGDASVSFDSRLGALPQGPVSRTIDGVSYRFTPRVFFQSNAFLLGRLVSEAVGGQSGSLALDLFCGVGLFTLGLARLYTEVVGVESGHDAAGFALENITGHGVANVRIINDEAENFARSYAARLRDGAAPEPDLVLLDPPRTGAAEVSPYLIDIAPRRIVYVSCDPTTLARDLRSLIDAGYVLARITGFDLFPQTYHVETVAALERLT